MHAGSFLRCIGERLSQKFQELALAAENKIEWKASVLTESELIFALANSIRVRQKSSELVAAAKDWPFGRQRLASSEKIRTDTLNAAMRQGDPSLIEGKEAVTFRTAELYLGITDRQRQYLIKRGSLIVIGQGQNRLVTTESLTQYLPPRKTEATRSDPK